MYRNYFKKKKRYLLLQAILVKGVVTNDIVGRPTEIRFFYKQAENENFVVYFPNFNLTMRDPGNYGELAMITLPKYVQARFVILGTLERSISIWPVVRGSSI